MILPAQQLDPYSRENLVERRHEFYRFLRNHSPVYLHQCADPRQTLCLITGYAEVAAAFCDPRLKREFGVPRYAGPARAENPTSATFESAIASWMVYRDAPRHFSLRNPFNVALQAHTRHLADLVRATVAEQLSHFSSGSVVDLLDTLAFATPARLITRLAGIDLAEHGGLATFRRWISFINAALEHSSDELAWQRADEVTAELHEISARAIARTRHGDCEPFLGTLLAAIGTPASVSDRELLGNLVLFLLAGHETTMNLIANSFWCLLNNPDQLQHMLDRPELIPAAVEECLRYEPAVSATYRGVTVDTELQGVLVPAKTRVALVLGSSGRDQLVFDQPDIFDIQRESKRNLAFGYQVHYCPGAALGRLETECCLREFFQRFPRTRLVDKHADWKPILTYRALEQLPVVVG